MISIYCTEIRARAASYYLSYNYEIQKITAERQDKDKHGKLFLRERVMDKNGWQHVYQADKFALQCILKCIFPTYITMYITYQCSSNWDIDV